MEQLQFRNWETLVHTLPGLRRLTVSMIEDAQTSESREVLLRRFTTLHTNVSAMAIAASQVNHLPQRLEPLVGALLQLDKVISVLHDQAKDGDYEQLIGKICEVQQSVNSFLEGVQATQSLLTRECVVHVSRSAVASMSSALIVNR